MHRDGETIRAAMPAMGRRRRRLSPARWRRPPGPGPAGGANRRGPGAAAGQAIEPRDPVDALLGAAHDADATVQQIKRQFADGRLTAAELEALGSWLDRVGRLAKTVLDARIDERRVRLSEQQGQLLAGGLEWFLRTSIPTDQHADARQQIGRMLRALGRGEVPGERPAAIEGGP